MNIKTQQDRIFDYLKANKQATGLELLRKTGAICYTKAITRLRRSLPEKGYTIIGEFVNVKTAFNGKSRVMIYKLAKLKKSTKSTDKPTKPTKPKKA